MTYSRMKLISVVTPCFNEEENIEDVYTKVKHEFEQLPNYQYEHIFIDNCSQDKTVSILRDIAQKDQKVKIIVNARNFGFVRSSYYGLLQAYGDAIIFLLADLQDPPSMISKFIHEWEQGHKVVQGVRTSSKESFLLFTVKKLYYYVLNQLSDIQLTRNTTGFGLYDKQVMDMLRQIDDPYPYFKGLISELGFESKKLQYVSAARKRGVSSANFLMLYDFAMLGITSHSKLPLRLATITGFFMALLSLLISVGYIIYKLLYWDLFPVGTASLLVGIFFLGSVQLFFIGILGEYIGFMHTQILKRPIVIERERINFE